MRKEQKKRIAKILAVFASIIAIVMCTLLPISAVGTVSEQTKQWATQGQVILEVEYNEASQYTEFVETNEGGIPWLPTRLNHLTRLSVPLSRPYINNVNGEIKPHLMTEVSGAVSDDRNQWMITEYKQYNFNQTPFFNDYSEEEQIYTSASDIGEFNAEAYSIGEYKYITINVKMKDIFTWEEGPGYTSQVLRLYIPTASIVNDYFVVTEDGIATTVTKQMIFINKANASYRRFEDYETIYEVDAPYTITTGNNGEDTIITFDAPKPNNANSKSVYEIENYEVSITMRVLSGLYEVPIEYKLDYGARTDINQIRYDMIQATKYDLPPIVDLTEWLGESVSAFMNFQLVEGITIGGIFTVLIGFSVVMWLLKMFAGG